jgi:hypothetical protein
MTKKIFIQKDNTETKAETKADTETKAKVNDVHVHVHVHVVNNNYYNNNNNRHRKNILCDLLKQGQIYDDNKMNYVMIESVKGGSYIINAIMHVFKNKLQYVDGSWYHFGSRWVKHQNFDIIIVRKFIPLYHRIREYITDHIAGTKNEKNEYICQLNDSIYEILNVKKQNKICEELTIHLERNVIFDANMNLFAFNNGVYDFEKMCFRKIKPEDLITMSTGYDYSGTYVDKQKLLNTLTSLFPDKIQMDCFIMYLALNLCGRFDLRSIMIFQWMSTDTSNGVYLENFMIHVFGDYCTVLHNMNILSDILSDSSKNQNLTKKRLLIIESADKITEDEIEHLVIKKYVIIKTQRIPINFSTLCFCKDKLVVEESVKDFVSCIRFTEKEKSDIRAIPPNDIFLLLIEYLCAYINNDIFAAIKYITAGNEKCKQ